MGAKPQRTPRRDERGRIMMLKDTRSSLWEKKMDNNEELFHFNEYYIKMLRLSTSDHENVRAILKELGEFKTLAERATELNKTVLQLEEYGGESIKISLGLDGCITWPADELIGKAKAKMSDAVMALKAQEMIIDKMAAAISGEVSIEPEAYAADMWLLQWRRDVNAFGDKHTWILTRFINALLTHGADQQRIMLKEGVGLLAGFREALPAIASGDIPVRNCGELMQAKLQMALDNEGEEQE